MLLLVDSSFSSTGADLGSLEGCIDFAKLVDEPYDIKSCSLQDPNVAAGLGNGQFDATRILDAFELYRQQAQRRMMILTSLDLTAYAGNQWLNFVFGLSYNGTVCVTSTYRFTQALPTEIAQAANRLITMHELGHVWDLVPENSMRSDRRSGMFTGHCTATCAMRQVVSVKEVVDLATELGTISFCADCHNHLTS